MKRSREPTAAVLKPNAAGEGTARSARFPEAIGARAGWLKEGKLKQKEDVAIGNAPNTLARLFTGENFGKQLLKIADGRLFPGDARGVETSQSILEEGRYRRPSQGDPFTLQYRGVNIRCGTINRLQLERRRTWLVIRGSCIMTKSVRNAQLTALV